MFANLLDFLFSKISVHSFANFSTEFAVFFLLMSSFLYILQVEF